MILYSEFHASSEWTSVEAECALEGWRECPLYFLGSFSIQFGVYESVLLAVAQLKQNGTPGQLTNSESRVHSICVGVEGPLGVGEGKSVERIL